MSKIIFVEDTENNRILVARQLRKKGYEILTAESAVEGIELIRKEKPDLVLMDMGLPEVDGWEATRRLRADPKTETIPIIALTAHAMAGDREKSLSAGCDEYETKPFDFPRLIEKMETLLRTGRGGGS